MQAQEALRRLREHFRRHGVLRKPNTRRRAVEKSDYHKGYEVRLMAGDARELAEIRRWLEAAGLKPAKPFAKARQFAQPVYGKHAVDRIVGE